MPHKRAILPFLDGVDEGARLSGAVNTVVVEDATLRGYNTDGGGLVEACREAGIDLAGRRVLLLGAGGGGRHLAFAFGGEGIGELRIANRTVEHAIELRDKLRGAGLKQPEVYPPCAGRGGPRGRGYRECDAPGDERWRPSTDTNRTSGRGQSGLRRGVPSRQGYRPDPEARERGARVVTGERMLLYQGVLAQRLWTGREPNVKAMDGALA